MSSPPAPPRVRSVLFMPADNARAIDKARGLASDGIVLDLEDAVAPGAKEAARAMAVAAVREGGFGARAVVVRVNALGTPWIEDDLAALDGLECHAVIVPKVDAVDDLRRVRARLPGRSLWAMVETCRGVLALGALSAAAEDLGLTALVAGTNDLGKDMRCRPDAARTPLLPALSQIVVAARAAGIVALDGVCNALGQHDVLAAECAQGAMLGFDGKTLIHPEQVDAANRAFGPTAREIDWAQRVVDGFAAPENAARGAIRLGGEMIERLHLVRARQILAAR